MVGWNNWLQPFGHVRLSTLPRCPGPAATAEEPQPRRVHFQSPHCPVQRAATQRVESSRPPSLEATARQAPQRVGLLRSERTGWPSSSASSCFCDLSQADLTCGGVRRSRAPRSMPHSGPLHCDPFQHPQRYWPQQAGLKQRRVFGPVLPGGECQTTGRARFIFQQPFWPAC